MKELPVIWRLSQFVLNNETEEIRDRLYESLILLAITGAKKKALTLSQLDKQIKKITPFIEIDISKIQHYIDVLVNKREINEIYPGNEVKYIFSEHSISEMRTLDQEFDETRQKAENVFIAKLTELRGNLSEKHKKKALNMLYDALGNIFSTYGSECATTIIGGDVTKFRDDYVAPYVSKLPDFSIDGKLELKHSIKYAIGLFLSLDDKIVQKFLYWIASSYFVSQIMYFDPECHHYAQKSLKDLTIYLDTNILISFVTKEESIFPLLEVIRNLGVNVLFTKRTEIEYLRVMKNFQNYFASLANMPGERFQKIKKHVNQGFFSHFMNQKARLKSLQWDKYCMSLLEIKPIMKGFAEYVDTPIKIENKDEKNFERLKGCVEDRDSTKTPEVVEHDALHIYHIRKIRDIDDSNILGPKFWFLTLDKTLSKAERDFDSVEIIPSSILASIFYEIISPLCGAKIIIDQYQKIFSGLLKNRFPSLAGIISEKDLLSLEGPWIDDPNLSGENVAQIIGNTHVRKLLRRRIELGERINKEDFSLALQPLIHEIKNQRKRDLRVYEGEDKIEKLEKKIKEQNLVIKSRKKREKYLWGTIAILGSILFSILFLISIALLLNAPPNLIGIFGIILSIGGTILVAALQFQEFREKILQKINEWKSI